MCGAVPEPRRASEGATRVGRVAGSAQGRGPIRPGRCRCETAWWELRPCIRGVEMEPVEGALVLEMGVQEPTQGSEGLSVAVPAVLAQDAVSGAHLSQDTELASFLAEVILTVFGCREDPQGTLLPGL